MQRKMTNDRWFWTDQKRARLIELAASGMVATDIGAQLGATEASIITICGRNGIAIVKYSPEVQAMYDRRAKDRQAKQDAKKVALNHAKKVAERAAAMARGDFSSLAVATAHSKTSVAYRRALAPVGEMTKSQLLAMLEEAARNTAALPVPSEASV